jgi:hypothetical protein
MMKNLLPLALLSFSLAYLLASVRFKRERTEPAGRHRQEIFSDAKRIVSCSPAVSLLSQDSLQNSIPALPGWGVHQWKISTRSDSAQFYFNQGISLYYGFHIIEAEASFQKAADFDPQCAMAFWGQALAYGPNINDAGFYMENPAAWIAIKKADSLSRYASERERSLIKTQLTHYSADTPVDRAALNIGYAEAMKKLHLQFSNDGDIATLYADALMNLHAWDFYEHNGRPKNWTPELTELLGKILRQYPNHPGAIHYYIHALEASNHAELALPYARKLDTLMPDVAHMVHMASHIYIRTGRYEEGILSNRKAVDAFRKYLNLYQPSEGNSILYYGHNVDMEGALAQMACRYAESGSAYRDIQQSLQQSGLSMMETGGGLGEYVQYIYMQPLLNWVRFGKWDSILAAPAMSDKYAYANALWHFARGMALLRKSDALNAGKELAALQEKIPVPSMQVRYGPFNVAADGARLAAYILQGEMALHKGNTAEGIALLKKAVDQEMVLNYNEPADWRIPARHYLGAALIRNKQAAAAEQVYREDLHINPDNPWSLKGLEMALTMQKKKAAALSVAAEFKAAAAHADLDIRSSAF